jgi:RHS repeat-associated protein
MTVYKPGNASTAYTFTLNNGAWPTQIQSYDSSGNLLSTANNTYDFSVACPFSGCYGAGYIRLLTSKTTVAVPGGASITKQTMYTYDSPHTGNVTAVQEWRYYSGTSPTFLSVPDRATYKSYLTTGTNNINRPLRVTVCNNSGSDSDCSGGGSKVSQTLYTYDAYSSCTSGLTPVSGVVNHDDTNFGSGYTQRGNPTQIQRWVSGSTYLAAQLCYDTTGQVLKAVDPAGNPTTYSYSDNFFNETGASSMSSYTPAPPTNAYPTSITAGGLTTTIGYYFGSGRQSLSTDPNNISTYQYYFDPFDRHTQTNFPIGWVLTNYTSATQADTYVPVADASPSSGCTSCRHNQFSLDTWGRKVNQKLVNAPGGAINVDTSYDSTGRVQSVSHAYVNTSDPSHVFETFAYDGLDRKISVTHPDNQSSQVFYGPFVSGPGGGGGLSSQQGSTSIYGYGYPVLTVEETGTKKRQEWVDGFGRIIEVDEPVTASTPGIGTATISGYERSTYYYPCGVSSCPTLVYDSGTVNVTVKGFTSSAFYSQNDTSSTVASSLASYFNSQSNSPVTASVSGSSLSLTSKATGASTNYTMSTTSSTSSQYFSGSSFGASLSGSSLSGGFDSGSSFSTPLVTLYTYDALGNLTQVVQGVQTRTFTYDGLGRRTSMTTPEAGTDNFYFTMSDNVTLCAGAAGAVCRKTDARGITTTYAYDAQNRLTGKAYSNGQGAVTLQYDQGGAAAFALGRLTKIIDPSGSEAYTYDRAGRITQRQKVIGTTTYPISYQYNTGGQLTQITYPSNRVVQQNVDNVGLLNTIVSGTTTYASIPEPPTGYNTAGQLLTFTYGNGVVANFGYSAARQQMTGLSYLKGTLTLFNLNYYYQKDSTNCTAGTTGNDGLIECITDGVDSGRTINYTYDALNRLSTAVTNGSSAYAQWGISETFDQYGNRLSQSVTAGSGPSNSLSFATTPSAGAYTNRPDGYSFDPSGNMLNDGSNTLTYDAENCLTSAGTSTYTCDADGIRVQKALQGSTTTAYVFSGGKDIAEYDNAAPVNSPSREYIYLGGRLIATIQGTSTVYHHADHLAVRVTSDASGNKIGEQGHYPYGETWYVSNTTAKFIFTSYERDSESGNDYAMARFYINRFGRFSCVDPLLGRPADPQTWNRYAYVRNNPTNNVDPSGMGFLDFLVNFFKMLLSIFTGGKLGWSLPVPGTPPIFSDPLGNTQATLNSIYHPTNPSSYIIVDFSPVGHDQLFWNALGPCGLTKLEIWAVQKASRDLDNRTQAPNQSYIHSMSDGTQDNFNGTVGQSAADAIALRNDFITQRMVAARAAWGAGRQDEALADFGEAMHPVTDALSPEHTDAQGNPIPWCGKGGCPSDQLGLNHDPVMGPAGVVGHVLGETKKYLSNNPDIQEKANAAIRNAFKIMTGTDCI